MDSRGCPNYANCRFDIRVSEEEVDDVYLTDALETLSVAEMQILYLTVVKEMKVEAIADFRNGVSVQVVKNQKNSIYKRLWKKSIDPKTRNIEFKHVIKPWLIQRFSNYEEIETKHSQIKKYICWTLLLTDRVTGEVLKAVELDQEEYQTVITAYWQYENREIEGQKLNCIACGIINSHPV